MDTAWADIVSARWMKHKSVLRIVFSFAEGPERHCFICASFRPGDEGFELEWLNRIASNEPALWTTHLEEGPVLRVAALNDLLSARAPTQHLLDWASGDWQRVYMSQRQSRNLFLNVVNFKVDL